MAGVHPLEDLAPRDVVAAAISDRMAEAPAGVDDHVYLDATHLGERFYDPLPVDHRGVPGDRRRPGPRPHPRGAGRALRLRRRAGRPRRDDRARRALRRRRGVLHRRARRQPAGVEQPDRERRRRDPARSRPGVGGARAGRAATSTHARGGRARRRTSQPRSAPRCPGTSASTATPSRSRPRPPSSTPSPARSTRPDRRRRAAWESTNLLTVASAVVLAAATRSESRGCHRRTDHPEPVDAWLRHLDVRARRRPPGGRLIVQFHPLPDSHAAAPARRRPRSRRRRRARAHGRSTRI